MIEINEGDNVGINRKIRIGDLLVNENIITQEQLEKALKEQKLRNTRLGETIIDLGFASEDAIIDLLCRQLKIEYVDLRKMKLEEKAVYTINESIAKQYMVIPVGFSKVKANVLRLAMADPMDIYAIDDVSIFSNMQVEPVLSTSKQIAAQIDKYFGKQQAIEAAEMFAREHEQEKEKDETDESYNSEVENSPIVKIVNSVIEQAVRRRASDIHIEPLEFSVRIRFRIDGRLCEVMSYDSSLASALSARIKIKSGMDISEKRKPQDGRMTVIVDRYEYDIRVSSLPTVFGEKIVMRIASKEGITRSKKELGFNDAELNKFDNILKHPHGIILVTGPTGSGKSTTLYTALSELNTEGVNIITVEDPVEANIDGINQVQVNNKAELTFASALRSILRQDPDIIMIGEIRDGETADIAIRASITGHLVVSTLHTNSTASSISRLIDMGIEPYLIGDALTGIIAQRLVRRLCECKKCHIADENEKKMLGISKNQNFKIYTPVGCEICNHTGYFGRIGIYEIMEITPQIRNLISEHATVDAINKAAVAEGMSTLKRSAARKVVTGITSMDEYIRIAYEM